MSRRPASSKYDVARLKYIETEKLYGNLSTEGGIFEIVLASPKGYGPAMSSLRFQNFFRQLASWPETSCERAFYPPADEYHWRSRYGHPAVTLETGKSIRRSDLLAFSLSDESEYLKVLQMMELAGMELRSEKRTDKWPLVIVSGIPVTANPLPLSMFMDAFVIGETDSSIGPVLDTIKSMGAQGASKKKLLRRLATLPGIYVPSIHEIPGKVSSIMRQWAGSDGMGSTSCVTSPECVYGDLRMVEISRGCPFNCKFCQVGYVSLPYRECKLEDIEDIMTSLSEDGSIVLTACSPKSHPEIRSIINSAAKCKLEVKLSSHKTESSATMEDLAHDLKEYSIILAPETGSDSLRKIIGKKLTNERLLTSLERRLSKENRSVRIYFMIGMPFETDLDRAAIIEFVAAVRKLTDKPIQVVLKPFVPKPWMAFQWSAMARPDNLRKWIDTITTGLKKLKKIKVRSGDPREAHIQALLARGDRSICGVLEDKLTGMGWNTAFENAGIDMRWVFRELKPESSFGWDFLNMGFGHTRLSREYQASVSAHLNRMKAMEKDLEKEVEE